MSITTPADIDCTAQLVKIRDSIQQIDKDAYLQPCEKVITEGSDEFWCRLHDILRELKKIQQQCENKDINKTIDLIQHTADYVLDFKDDMEHQQHLIVLTNEAWLSISNIVKQLQSMPGKKSDTVPVFSNSTASVREERAR